MGRRYLNPHLLLAEEMAIPVRFLTGSAGLGRALDPASDQDDVAAGADVDIPLWMAHNLAARKLIQLMMPPSFAGKMRRKLQVGAEVENLRARCPYFYTVAEQFNGMITSEDIPTFVTATFTQRYKDLLTKAHSGAEGAMEVAAIRQLLTIEELRIFESGRSSVAAFDRWRHSELVPNRGQHHVKRKYAGNAPETSQTR